MYRYSLYGLNLESEVALPMLRPAVPDAAPVATIRRGAVAVEPGAEPIGLHGWHAAPGRFVIAVPSVARYRVTDGTTIAVEAEAGADARDVVAFLLGSPLAALLQQRRLLPLHASAVATPTGAMLFGGRSGAGKSTLLAALVQAGLPMMADDVSVVVADGEETPTAWPAFPAMRLWSDTARLLGLSEDGLDSVRPEISKFYHPVASFHAEPLPIRAVVSLSSHSASDTEMRWIAPRERVALLARDVYRKNFATPLGVQPAIFAAIVALARVPVARIVRPAGERDPGGLARRVIDFLDAGPQ